MGAIRLHYATSRGATAAAIRWFSDSDWSHVDAVTPDGWLLGARSDRIRFRGVTYPSGVQRRPIGYGHFSRTLVADIETPHADAFYAAIAGEIGKPYDWQAIVDFVIHRNRNWRSDRAWFCDELVLAKAEAVGIFPHRLAIPAAHVNPGGSLLAFSALPGFHTNF